MGAPLPILTFHALNDKPAACGCSMLSWREIQEMQRRGITFEAHTLAHPDLTHSPLEQVKADIHDSKALIENAFQLLEVMLSRLFSWYIRARDIPRRIRRAIKRSLP